MNKVNEPNLLNYLDLVSLGTICDVVPLKDLNRAFVKQGLKILKQKKNLGLKTLLDICNIETTPNTYHLGYILGPRINAGGESGNVPMVQIYYLILILKKLSKLLQN